MAKLSQTKKIAEFLKGSPKQRFSARQIAEAIVEAYPQDYAEKRNNPRFESEKSFITQIVAEIGSQKDAITKASKCIFWQDKPRPRVYWYDSDKQTYPTPETDSDNCIEDAVVTPWHRGDFVKP